MTTVARLLDNKGNDIWSVTPEASVYDTIKLMADKGVGAVLVMEGNRLAGIVSERDYARKVILQGRSSKDTPVREIMTTKLITVEPDQTIDDCMALMTEHRIRHLPVMADGRLSGVLSIGDVVKSAIADKEQLIQQLESYITGR